MGSLRSFASQTVVFTAADNLRELISYCPHFSIHTSALINQL